MKDEFKQNFRIPFLAALMTGAVLIFEGFLLEASNSNFGSTSVDLV